MMDFVINAYGGRGLALMSSLLAYGGRGLALMLIINDGFCDKCLWRPWFSLNAIFVMHFVIVHQKVEKSKERIK